MEAHKGIFLGIWELTLDILLVESFGTVLLISSSVTASWLTHAPINSLNAP